MPVYSYRCESCGIQFERFQKFSDQPLTRCPECGKKTLRKVYTPVGIVFKGSGFYATDNRSPSGGGRINGNSKNESKAGEGEKEPAPSAKETKPSPVEKD
ncbi:MAG: zinc ribbon domain-containing protein [Chloroflexi bacterium]|nr:zinc ribbon domain-containing protein [Chloroflexota bacterium]